MGFFLLCESSRWTQLKYCYSCCCLSCFDLTSIGISFGEWTYHDTTVVMCWDDTPLSQTESCELSLQSESEYSRRALKHIAIRIFAFSQDMQRFAKNQPNRGRVTLNEPVCTQLPCLERVTARSVTSLNPYKHYYNCRQDSISYLNLFFREIHRSCAFPKMTWMVLIR